MNSIRPLNLELDHWDWLTDHESQLKEHESSSQDLVSVLDIISCTNTINDVEEDIYNV